MREVLDELMTWWRAGDTVALGTVVATFQSAPRPAGASMIVGPGGEAVGSVSGGCVEGAVYELGQEVAADGTPVLQRYGISDDDAFAVGLTCGGILDVYVEKVDRDTFPELGRDRRRHRCRPSRRRGHRRRASRPGPTRPPARRTSGRGIVRDEMAANRAEKGQNVSDYRSRARERARRRHP